MLRRLAVAICLLIIPALLLSPGVGASEVPSITLESAIQRAYVEGADAKKARIELLETLLQAAELEHQHRMGPPGRQSITITIPLEDLLGEGTPPLQMSLPIGGPTDLEKAQVEEVLPIQFDSLRRTAAAAYEQRMASVRAGVIEAYFSAILAQEEVELRRAAVERVEAQLNQVRALFEAGVVPELDVVQVEAALAGAASELFEAEENASLAAASLNRLLGLPLDARPVLLTEDASEIVPQMDTREDVLESRGASAELAALVGQLEVAEKEMELYRRIKGTFSARRAYRERELEVERKEIEIHELQVNLEMGVLSLHSRIARASDQADSLFVQKTAARRGLDVARLRYEAGMTTVTDVLEAQTSLLGTELAEMAASVEILKALADRDTFLGRVGTHVEERMLEIEEDIDSLR